MLKSPLPAGGLASNLPARRAPLQSRRAQACARAVNLPPSDSPTGRMKREDLVVRPLEADDFHRGHLSLLGQLT